MVTKLFKHALSNAFRHGLHLRAGKLNAANGNCLWDSILNNILGRICFKRKLGETSKQLRVRSLTEAQNQSHLLTFIESNTTEAELAHMKTDKVFETKQGDICLVAAARAIHKDILVFNTNKHISISPIEIICADHYENPILLAYNGIHCESLETMSLEDEKKPLK